MVIETYLHKNSIKATPCYKKNVSMSNNQFVVMYNGHPVEVTGLDNDRYLVQVSYKPVTICLEKNEAGSERWVDAETYQESYLSREVGKLISSYLCLA